MHLVGWSLCTWLASGDCPHCYQHTSCSRRRNQAASSGHQYSKCRMVDSTPHMHRSWSQSDDYTQPHSSEDQSELWVLSALWVMRLGWSPSYTKQESLWTERSSQHGGREVFCSLSWRELTLIIGEVRKYPIGRWILKLSVLKGTETGRIATPDEGGMLTARE